MATQKTRVRVVSTSSNASSDARSREGSFRSDGGSNVTGARGGAANFGAQGQHAGQALFHLRPLLRLQTRIDDKGNGPLTRPVSVELSAAETVSHHCVCALYCSNDYLILFYYEAEKTPIVRYLPWYIGSARKITSMCFDPAAEWLLCGCYDGSIHLLPVLALLTPETTSTIDPPPADRCDATSFPPIQGLSSGRLSCLTWWRTHDGTHVGIIGSSSGLVTFMNIATKELLTSCTKKVKGGVRDLLVLTHATEGSDRLLIRTDINMMFEMNLSMPTTEVDGTSARGLVDITKEPSWDGFRPRSLQGILPSTTTASSASPQRWFAALTGDKDTSHQPRLAISHISSLAGHRAYLSVFAGTTLSLFDLDLDSRPLFQFHHVPGTSAAMHSPQVSFASCTATLLPDGTVNTSKHQHQPSQESPDDRPSNTVLVVSNLLSSAESSQDSAVLQRIQLGPGESVIAFLPGPTTEILDTADQLSEQQGPRLSGCVIITSSAIYDCVPMTDPRQLCLERMRLGHNVDLLAGSLGVDLFDLHRQLASELLEKGRAKNSLQHSLEANADPLEMVSRLARRDLLWLAMHLLRRKLADARSLQAKLRRQLSDQLATIYICLLCTSVDDPISVLEVQQKQQGSTSSLNVAGRLGQRFSRPGSEGRGSNSDSDDARPRAASLPPLPMESLDQKLSLDVLLDSATIFLRDSFAYSEIEQMKALLEASLIPLFVDTAQKRNVNYPELRHEYEELLPLIVLRHADLFANESTLRSLLDPSLDVDISQQSLLSRQATPFDPASNIAFEALASLEADTLVRFVLDSGCNVATVIRVTLPLIPQLSLETLIAVLKAVNPVKAGVRAILQDPSDDPVQAVAFDGAVPADVYAGLILRILLALERLRVKERMHKHHVDLFSPWNLRPEEQLLTIDHHNWNPRTLAQLGVQISDTHNELDEAVDDQPFVGADATQPSRILAMDGFVACGTSHAAAITPERDLVVWGRPKDGRLGIGELVEDSAASHPWRVPTFEMFGIDVLGVACGDSHTVARTDKGIYAWGSNTHGQLGIGVNDSVYKPAVVTELDGIEVVAVACGANYSIALSENGVWLWGQGTYGQLGFGSVEDEPIPKLHPELSRLGIVAASARAAHSLFLTRRGTVLGCGRAEDGQLGPMSTTMVVKPTPFDVPAPVRLIAAGPRHTALVTYNDKLYLYGKPLVADSQRSPRRHTVTEIQLPFPAGRIVKMSLGIAHLLILSDDGRLLSLGSTAAAGHDHLTTHVRPVQALVDNFIEAAAAGHDFSVAVDKQGQLWAWGTGPHGELGGGAQQSRHVPLPVAIPPAAGGRTLSECSDASDSSLSTLGRTPAVWVPSMAPSTRWKSLQRKQLSDVDEAEAEDQATMRPSPLDALLRLPDLSVSAAPFSGWAIPLCCTALGPLIGLGSCLQLTTDWNHPFLASHFLLLHGKFAKAAQYRLACLLDTMGLPSQTASTNDTDTTSLSDEQRTQLEKGATHVAILMLNALSQRQVLRMQRSQATVTSMAPSRHESRIASASETPVGSLEADVTVGPSSGNRQPQSSTTEQSNGQDELETQGLLRVLLSFWVVYGLNMSALEPILGQKAQLVASPMLKLLWGSDQHVHNEGNAENGHEACLIRRPQGKAACFVPRLFHPSELVKYVSAGLVVRFAQFRIRPSNTARRRARLLTTLADNCEKAAGERPFIVMTAPAPRDEQLAITQPTTRGPDTMLFSCGHVFSHSSLQKSVLVEFKRRIEAFPESLSKWADLACTDFASNRPSMACPLCVYASLRRSFLDINPNSNIPEWRR